MRTAPASFELSTIRQGLSTLRFKARSSLSLRGFATMALTLVALALLSFALDRTLRHTWNPVDRCHVADHEHVGMARDR